MTEAHSVSKVRFGNDFSSPLQVIQSSINLSHDVLKLSLNQTQTLPHHITATLSLDNTTHYFTFAVPILLYYILYIKKTN